VEKATARFGTRICSFRCDNGREYLSKEIKDYFRSKEIVYELTVPYTLEQNGVAERLNRTILDKARCMLLDSNLPKYFWVEAVIAAAYLINRCPTRALADNTVPEEMWYGTKPNYRKLKVFGCIAYVCKPKMQINSKFDTRSKKCVLLGYADNGYRLWSLDENNMIVACNVIFEENKRLTGLNDNPELYIEDHRENNVSDYDVGKVGTQDDVEHEGNDNADVENEGGEIIEQVVRDMEPMVTRSGRIVRRPAYLENYALSAMAYSDDVPISYSAIEDRSDRIEWRNDIKKKEITIVN
jgi:hypothetical protein